MTNRIWFDTEEAKLASPINGVWLPYPVEGSQVLYDVLVVGSVQRFQSDGPCYCEALGKRFGAMTTDSAARERVEREARAAFSAATYAPEAAALSEPDLIQHRTRLKGQPDYCWTDWRNGAPAYSADLADKIEIETRRLYAHHAPQPADATPSQATCDVITERWRQVEEESWTAEHDARHDKGEIARAAACYALRPQAAQCAGIQEFIERLWPWDWSELEPVDRRRDLVRAGALIIAKIERLDRAAARSLLKEGGDEHL